MDPRELQHRAHATSRDHTGTGGRGLQQHAARAEDTHGLVGDGAAVPGHPEEILLGALHTLLDRERDLVGLAVAHTHHFPFVADHHERGEREAPPALDDLGDTVDLDDPLLEVQAGGIHGAICGDGGHRRSRERS